VWWGSNYSLFIVCGGAVITGLVVCVLGQSLQVWYSVWCGSVYSFWILCGGVVITDLVLRVLRQ